MEMQDITSTRHELLGVCDKVASYGEECVFFSVNASTEDIFCCGSRYGQEFLTGQASIVHLFLEFCKERYLQNQQQQAVESQIKTELGEESQNNITNPTVKNATTDDDIIYIISDDEEDEFDELAAETMETVTKSGKFTIEIERLDSDNLTENLGLMNVETVPSETNLNSLNIDEGSIKQEICDNDIEENDNINRASSLSFGQENEINDKTAENELSSENTVGCADGLPSTGLASHIKGGLNMCQTCGESFFSLQALQNHIKLHVSRRDVKKAYMRAHAGEKPFICNICGKQFQDTGPLMNHMKIHQRESSVNKEERIKTCKSDEKVVQHKCKICKGRFESSKLLETHIEKMHNSRAQFHKCCVCEKYCSTWYNLKTHTLTHFRDQKFKPVVSQDKKEKVQCRICYKLFSNHNNCLRHEQLHKIHTNKMKTQCTFCFKWFSNKTNCKRHEQLHTKHRKSHKCQYCSKLFADISSCRRHEKIHKRSKNFRIKMKPVKKSSSLIKKSKNESIKNVTDKLSESHSSYPNKKIFKCQICSYVTKRFVDLKLHALKHFHHDKHNCGVCGKHFVYPGHLKSHWKMHLNNNNGKRISDRKKKILESDDKVTKMKKKSVEGENRVIKTEKITSEVGKHIDKTERKNLEMGKQMIKNRMKSLKDRDEVTKTCMKKELEDEETSKLKEKLKHVNEINPKDVDMETLKCKICDRMFNRRANLSVHMKLHKSKNVHQCKICNQSFKLYCYLKFHLARKHNLAHKSYKNFAKVIPVDSKKADNDTSHGESLNQRSELSCQSCGKTFTERRYLTKHLKNNCQLVKGSRCSVCYRVFRDFVQLKVHSTKCTLVSRPFQCQVCGKRCANIGNLRQHTAIHKKDGFKNQIEKSKTLKKSSSNLNDGFKLKTLKQEPQFSQNETDSGSFNCRTCDKTFTSAKSLANHNRVHVRGSAKLGSSESKPVVEKTYYLCRLCDKAFEDSKLLKKHWKVHGDQEKLQEKPFQCKTCLKTFFDKDVLKWHETTHLQSKSYQCKVCKTKVFGSDTFKIHMQLHKLF